MLFSCLTLLVGVAIPVLSVQHVVADSTSQLPKKAIGSIAKRLRYVRYV